MTHPAAPGRRFALTATSLAILVLAGLAANLPLHAQVPVISEVTPTATPKPTPPPVKRKPRPKPPVSASLSLLWKTLIHSSDGSPALAEGMAYVTAGGQVQQVDSGGHILYAAEIGTSQTTPAVDEARLYVGTDRGTVYGLNRKNGKVLWKWVGAANPVLTTPAFGAGRVYVESSDNNIYGLAAATGGRIWTFTRPDGSLGYSGPVFLREDDPALAAPKNSASDALFVCGDTTAYRVDPATGKEVWHAFVGGKSLGTPAIDNGKMIVAGDGSGITALSAADGHSLWNFPGKVEGDWFGAPISAGGVVYAATRERWAYAVDAANGKQKWGYRLPGSALAPPALDTKNRLLYITCVSLSDTPTLIALDSRTGVKKWETKAAGYISGSPAVNAAGTRIYVAGTANGYLYCFGTK